MADGFPPSRLKLARNAAMSSLEYPPPTSHPHASLEIVPPPLFSTSPVLGVGWNEDGGNCTLGLITQLRRFENRWRQELTVFANFAKFAGCDRLPFINTDPGHCSIVIKMDFFLESNFMKYNHIIHIKL